MNLPNEHIQIGDQIVVTSSDWFVAPDGKFYKSAYGTIKGIYETKQVLGIITNSRSTNWYLQVGNLTIGGCRVHHIVKTSPERVVFKPQIQVMPDGSTKEMANVIYNADK